MVYVVKRITVYSFQVLVFRFLTRFFEDYIPTGHRSKQLVMKNKLIEMV